MLVSAVIADGPPRRVLEVISDGGAELVLPEPVPVELRRVLGSKLALEADPIEKVLQLLDELVVDLASVPDQVEEVTGDADDDRILAAAAAAQADTLISGDQKHLLPLGRYGSMRIVRPQDFLAELPG